MRPAAFLQAPVSLTRQGRACPAPTYIQNSRPGSPQTRAALLIKYYGQYRIILSADTASEVRQLLSQKRR